MDPAPARKPPRPEPSAAVAVPELDLARQRRQEAAPAAAFAGNGSYTLDPEAYLEEEAGGGPSPPGPASPVADRLAEDLFEVDLAAGPRGAAPEAPSDDAFAFPTSDAAPAFANWPHFDAVRKQMQSRDGSMHSGRSGSSFGTGSQTMHDLSPRALSDPGHPDDYRARSPMDVPGSCSTSSASPIFGSPTAGFRRQRPVQPSPGQQRWDREQAGRGAELAAQAGGAVARRTAEWRDYEVINLRVVADRGRTGLQDSARLKLAAGDVVAGRYEIQSCLGEGTFSDAFAARDLDSGSSVCLKVVKNDSKDYFDQGLDEIKVLRYVNSQDPQDRHGILQLLDYFYFREHLFMVTELLHANLFVFQKRNLLAGAEPYFTPDRIRAIARQLLESLAFLHGTCGIIHADLKPENVVISSYTHARVKLIDFGSSCFATDRVAEYIQSRSYRAPEVILGGAYDFKVDVWSLGCILCELCTSKVLFAADSLAGMLDAVRTVLGDFPPAMKAGGGRAGEFFTAAGELTNPDTGATLPRRRSSLEEAAGGGADPGFVAFLGHLLKVDPACRPTAKEALRHPWLQPA